MNKNDLAIPSVHLNGTGKEPLRVALARAHNSLLHAQIALGGTAPHQRDFYVQVNGDHNYRRAVNQHEARYHKITEIMEELKVLFDEVDTGGYKGDRK